MPALRISNPSVVPNAFAETRRGAPFRLICCWCLLSLSILIAVMSLKLTG